jgi:hypothetical protein
VNDLGTSTMAPGIITDAPSAPSAMPPRNVNRHGEKSLSRKPLQPQTERTAVGQASSDFNRRGHKENAIIARGHKAQAADRRKSPVGAGEGNGRSVLAGA